MEIGIGIPNSVVGTTGPQLLEWARRAEAAGFSAMSSIGAVSYPTYEELTVFAAAGAVTERIRFVSNVLIAPARSTAELAKQAATVQQITSGRLTLGLGVGWRQDDFTVTDRDFEHRGRNFDDMLDGLGRAWSGQPVVEGTRPASPDPGPGGVPLLIGGSGKAAIRRAVSHGIGWTGGGVPPQAIPPFVKELTEAWTAEREGKPQISALVYFGLGDVDASRAYIQDYYQLMGPETATMIADNILTSPEAIKGAIAAYAEAGVDELFLNPTLPDPAQVELAAEAAL